MFHNGSSIPHKDDDDDDDDNDDVDDDDDDDDDDYIPGIEMSKVTVRSCCPVANRFQFLNPYIIYAIPRAGLFAV